MLRLFLFRYKRRGVDDDGHCANYVETEQIISYHNHQVSFVQVRGSVPVYWSQPGYKYRPPPRLDRGIIILKGFCTVNTLKAEEPTGRRLPLALPLLVC